MIRSEKLPVSTDEIEVTAINEGQTKLAISTNDRKIRIWELAKGKELAACSDLMSPRASAVILQVSPNGKWVAAGDEHGNVTLWELQESGVKSHTLRKPWLSHPVAILKFSSDDHWLFVASNDRNRYRYFGGLWKLDQQPFSTDAFRLNANVTEFRSASFARGGRWFVTDHRNAYWIWDLDSRDPSKSPVIVGSRETSRGKVSLADGVWKLSSRDDAVEISRDSDTETSD